MRAESTHFHNARRGREECTGVFRVGKYRIRREFDLYREDGGEWRLVRNDKEVKIG